MSRLLLHPLAPLCVFAMAATGGFVAYYVAGLSISASVQAIVFNATPILILLWILADARYRRRTPCFDFGFFCALFFPFSVPCYCIWSRGWRGILTLLLIIGLCIAPYVIAQVTWQWLYGRA